MQKPNVYVGRGDQILNTFSNNPYLALFATQSTESRGALGALGDGSV
jgi:hypothetical protein